MFFETYDMIIPDKDSLKEYELFYMLYGSNVKINVLNNQSLREVKAKLPILQLEVKEHINTSIKKLDNEYLMIGFIRPKTQRDNYEKSIYNAELEIKQKFFDDNYEKYLDYNSNFQQIISFYAFFEGTFGSYIRNGLSIKDIRQRELITKLINLHSDLVAKINDLRNLDLTDDNIIALWDYYTNIRNLYSHKGGVIDKKFKDELEKLSSKFDELLTKNFKFYQTIFENENLLRTRDFKIGDLFVISEFEIRFFRNYLITIWEAVYLLNHNKKIKDIDLEYKIILQSENNIYRFERPKNQDENNVLQLLPDLLTTRLDKFYLSGYICPVCIDNTTFFLYKTLFNPFIILETITNNEDDKEIKMQKAFTCPHCRSFFFPKFDEYLDKCNGFNYLKIEDNTYYSLLEKFNNFGNVDRY